MNKKQLEHKIPDGWNKKEFGDFINLSKEKHNPKNTTIIYKCIELEHISQKTGRLLDFTYSNFQLSTKNKFYKNDVLYGKLRPYLRKYLKPKFDGVCLSEIWVLKPNSKVCDSNFVFYLIQTNIFNYVANISTGTKMPRADWSYVSEYPFLLPPLPEQKKIADILTTWDNAIDKTESLINAKTNLKRGLMQKLLTGKVRFKEFEGQKWEMVKLREVAKLIKGITYKSIDYTDDKDIGMIFITIKCIIKNGGFNINGIKYYKGDYSNEHIIKSNDLIIANTDLTRAGDIVGCPVYVPSIKTEKPILMSMDISKLKTNNKINKEFLYYYLMTKKSRKFMKIHSSGSTVLHLKTKEVPNYKIPLPPLPEQQKIASVLSSIDREIDLLNNKLDMLKQQKKGLMQKLLTGKVRVKV